MRELGGDAKWCDTRTQPFIVKDAMIKAAPETPVDPPGGNITEQSTEYNGIFY